MAQQVEAIANTLLELGRIKGQGAANQGQIWGNTLAGLGQIPQQIQQGQAQQQNMQLRQQEMGLRGQEMQIRQGQIAQQQRGQEDQQSLDAAMQAGILQRPDGSYIQDRQKISDYLVTNGKGHMLPFLNKSWAEGDEIQAKVQKAKREAADAESEDIAAVATRGLTLLDHGASAEDAAGVVLPDINAHGKNGIISPDAQRGIVTQLDAAKSDPVALRTLLEGWRNASKTQSAALKDRAEAAAANANTTNRVAELPGIQAKSAEAQQVASTMVGGRTAAQIADDERQAAANAATQRNQEAERRLSAGRLKVEQDREKREGAAAAGAAQVAGVGVPDVPAGQLNEAFLKTLDPSQATLVKALAEGRKSFPSSFALKTPYWQGMLAAVAKYDPSFDEANYNARNKARSDLTSPNGTGGKTINALNTAIQHAGRLSDLIEKLDNYSSPLANAVVNPLRTAGGSSAVTNFNAVAPQLMKEIERAWRGTGGSTADIQNLIQSIGSNLGKQQQREALGEFVNLLTGKLDSTAQQRDNALGPLASKDVPVLFDQNKPILSKILSRAGGQTSASAAAPAAPRDGQESTVNGHQAVWKANGPQGPGWYAK